MAEHEPSTTTARIRAVVAYDGTEFHGWARQPGGLPTVQGTIEAALATVLRTPVSLECAGRTDAGVHAWGQVVAADVPAGGDGDASADRLDVIRLRRSVDRLCGPAIAIRSLERCADDFSPRFDAIARRYRYRLAVADYDDPFTARTTWRIGQALDVDAMRHAAAGLLGEHDFCAYCKVGASGGTIRRLDEITITDADADGRIDVWLEAASFCHQMVRSIVGMLIAIGSGRRPVDDAAAVLAARARDAIGSVAPAHGLTLWHVRYPEPQAGPAPDAQAP